MSVTYPKGFNASGVDCKIKKNGFDLALITSDTPANAAGVYTQNLVHAYCVDFNREKTNKGKLQAIAVNSGCANCLTGKQGEEDTLTMARLVAAATNIPAELIAVASTGVIGALLPMDKIEYGIKRAGFELNNEEGGTNAALAIMTTDTHPKVATAELKIGDKAVRVGGMSKGSGMIAPNMATMLGFITTDADIEPKLLQEILSDIVNRSFNNVTVDGDTSTNDMVLLLANGASGAKISQPDEVMLFKEKLLEVCVQLAKQIARDGEGATKLITINITGAKSNKDAQKAAKTIAESPLVKTAMHGADPNWGRFVAAAGRSGIQFDPSEVKLDLCGVTVFEKGRPADYDENNVHNLLTGKDIIVDLKLGGGLGEATAWTCDFSSDYVSINAHYRT